jgi:Na+/melibiose symporter-like transporter
MSMQDIEKKYVQERDYSASASIDSNESNDDRAAIFESDNGHPSTTLSWKAKLAYASVGLPYSMQLSIIAFYMNFFLLDVAKVRRRTNESIVSAIHWSMSLQVSPAFSAIILFTSRMIDALTDPIGGYIFSRVTFRWGKMKPW